MSVDPIASNRPRRDRAVTIVLLVASGMVAAVLAFAGLMLVMSSDSCGSNCNERLFAVGWILSMAVPIIGFAATLAWTIVRIVRRKTAYWVPIAGTLAFGLAFAGVVALAFSAL